MNKEILKQSQPTAYHILSSALTRHQVSHAWMITGPQGSPKEELALLFAQSLVCPHTDADGFACQECEHCKALETESNPNFFHVFPGGIHQKNSLTKKEIDAFWQGKDLHAMEQPNDASSWRIKKEWIQNLQNTFLYPCSDGEQQIYLLEHYDTATPEASNSLLKFIEEPRDNLIGILTADILEHVLPTIRSRCQILTLNPTSPQELKEELSQTLDDEELIDMMADNGYRIHDLTETFDPQFPAIRQAARSFFDTLNGPETIFQLETAVFNEKDSPSRTNTLLFLQWMMYYAKHSSRLNLKQSLTLRKILLDSINKLKIPVNRLLLCEQTLWKCTESLNT